MLHILLLLFVLIAVPSAAGQTFNVSSKFSISSCPITYFGQKYEEVYANFTNENFAVCFNGYYDPQAGGDCLLGPQTDIAGFDIVSRAETVEQVFLQNLPTISTSMECYIKLDLSNDLVFTVVNFGSQAALGLQLTIAVLPDMMFSVTDVLLNGIKVNKLNVSNEQRSDYLDVSACRHRGVAFETNTTNFLPKYCETVHCNDKAVLSVTSCGPMETCDGNNICVPNDNYIDEEKICPSDTKREYAGVVVPGHWNYTLYMKLYSDYGCTKHVDSNTPIRLNRQVWVKLSTKWLDEDVLVLLTDHCWATDQPSPFAEKKYDLIVDGCPADPTVILRGNGKETFNYFAFNMFEFTRGSNQIHLHCEMQLCVKNTNICEPDCDRKRQRRSAMFKYDYLGLISSLGWTI